MARRNLFKKSNTHSSAASCPLALEKRTVLAAIKDRKVLVLLDEQNLSITARNCGFELQYNLLAKRIRRAARAAELYIFIAADSDDHEDRKYFEKAGYIVHVKTIRHKRLPNGGRCCDSNIDNLFSFCAGSYINKTAWEVIVLGSGDYGLSGEIAQAIRDQRIESSMQIMTLSLPGSTAQALDAHKNPNVTANLEIGLDLLKPLSRSIRQFPARALGSRRTFRSGRFVNHNFSKGV